MRNCMVMAMLPSNLSEQQQQVDECNIPIYTPPPNRSDDIQLIVEKLDIFLCGFIDLPKSGLECSQRYPHFCVKCDTRGGYLTGETINEFGIGHWTCRILWYFTLLVCTVGVITNLLIITVIRRRRDNRSFDFLLSLLAHVDLLCCLTTFASSTAPTAYFENWHGRVEGSMYWIYASSITLLMFRSISIFVTLLITIERYLAIAYPLRSMTWFSKTKTRLNAAMVIFFAILISVPRYSSLYVGPNIYGSQKGGLDIPSLRHLTHIYLPTRLHSFWQSTFHGVHNQIEYWIPIPLLLLFNYLSYKKVKKLCKKRQQMNCSQRKELQAARMFTPVVVLLLCCNLWPTIAFVIMHFWGIFHREMWMIWSLTIAMNSAVNFWIYYYRAKTFRSDARHLLSQFTSEFPQSLRWKDSSEAAQHCRRNHITSQLISRNNNGSNSGGDTMPRCLNERGSRKKGECRFTRNHYVSAVVDISPQRF